MTDPQRVESALGSPESPGPRRGRASQVLLWSVLIVSLVVNAISSFAALSILVNVISGLIALSCIVFLIVGYVRSRK